MLPDRVDYQRNHLGLEIQEVIADRGYGRGSTYAQLSEQKIRHYIPLHDVNTGKGKLTPNTFKYERGKDRYRCPEGHYPYPYEKAERGSVRRYRVTGGHCRHCPIRNDCLPDGQKFRARFVYRGVHQDQVDAVRRRQSSKVFRQRLTERKWKIEGLFGEAKENHGLRRVRYRGLSKVQIQFLMIAIALNCKRIVALTAFGTYSRGGCAAWLSAVTESIMTVTVIPILPAARPQRDNAADETGLFNRPSGLVQFNIGDGRRVPSQSDDYNSV